MIFGNDYGKKSNNEEKVSKSATVKLCLFCMQTRAGIKKKIVGKRKKYKC